MPKIFGISYRGLTDRGRKYIEMSPGATLSRYASAADATFTAIVRDTSAHSARTCPALQPRGTYEQNDQDDDRSVRGPKSPAVGSPSPRNTIRV